MKRILHVDDVEAVCLEYQTVLQKTELYEVKYVTSGVQFLNCLAAKQVNNEPFIPDLLLVDVDLTHADDMEPWGDVMVASNVRDGNNVNYIEFRETPVVCLTNFADSEDQEKQSRPEERFWYCSKDVNVGYDGLLNLLRTILS